MDRRVIWIIIILVVGLGCMYYAVDNSTTIGNAITTFSKTTITIPNGFSVGETHDKYVELYNKNTDEKINVHDYGKGDNVEKTFKNLTEEYKKNQKYSDINDTTKNISNTEVYEINMQTENGTYYTFCFHSYNHTYVTKMYGFNDSNSVYGNLEFIIKTLQPDYKQAQD